MSRSALNLCLMTFLVYAVPVFVGCAIAFFVSRRTLRSWFVVMYLLPPVLWMGLEYSGYAISFRPVIKSLANYILEFFWLGVAVGLLAIVVAIMDRRGVSSPRSLRASAVTASLAL